MLWTKLAEEKKQNNVQQKGQVQNFKTQPKGENKIKFITQ